MSPHTAVCSSSKFSYPTSPNSDASTVLIPALLAYNSQARTAGTDDHRSSLCQQQHQLK